VATRVPFSSAASGYPASTRLQAKVYTFLTLVLTLPYNYITMKTTSSAWLATVLKNTRSTIGGIFLLVLLAIAMEQPAAAYTDPGTGALIWQMVAAGFVGVMFYFRRITAFFTRSKDKDPKE
jgi:hypothetical protein